MANQAKDPICGMTVDANQSPYKMDYHGKQYAFCCQNCLNTFKQNPSQYTHKQ